MDFIFSTTCYIAAILFVLWLRYTPEKAEAPTTQATEPTEVTEEIAIKETNTVSDPWEESVTALPQARQWVAAVKPQPQPVKPVLVLCPAKEVQPEPAPTVSTAEIDLNSLDAGKLRKLCSEYGIKWRSVHGKNRHATKTEMVSQLSTLNLSAIA
jgi:hypothetical protein